MMIECPRCGFSQPQDRYCANCGVDMTHYNPTPPPLYQKIWKNYALSISVVLVLVLVTFAIYYIQNQEIQNQETSTQDLAATTTSSIRSETSKELASPLPQVQKSTATPTSLEIQAKSNPPPQTHEKAVGLVGDKMEDSVSTIPTQVHILFSEVTSELSGELTQRGEAVGRDLKAFLVEFNQKLLSQINDYEKNNQLRKLGSGKSSPWKVNTPIQFRFMTHTQQPLNKEEMGLNLVLTPTQITNTSSLINVRGFVFLANEDSGDSYQITLQEQFEIPHGKTLALHRVFPQMNLKDAQFDELSDTPLKILNSPDFKVFATDFYIFIQPQP